MQVPAPLVERGPVSLEEDRRFGAVGPFTYEVDRDESLFVDAQDRRETWDFRVALKDRALGSGSCSQSIAWPGQAVGERPKWRSELRISLECDLSSLTSSAAITLSLRAEAGQDLVGAARRGDVRVEVNSTREIEGSRFPSTQRMGFIVAREGVPWAAIQTSHPRQAWLPPLEPGTEDLLGLVVVALATARPFVEEILSP